MSKFSKATKLLIIPVVALSLAACSSKAQDSSTSLTTPLEKDAGVYLGMFGKNSIDVETKDSKKMFSLSKDAKEDVESLDKNDVILFEYEQTDSGDLVIHSIEKVSDSDSVNENTDKEKEEVKKEDSSKEKVKKEKKEKENKDEEQEFNGYTLTVPSDIDVSSENAGSKFSLTENDDYSLIVEKIDKNEEVVKERWRAAGILKEIGDLKELKDSQIPYSFLSDADFVFSSNDDSLTEIIAVKTIDGERFRFTFNHPTNDSSLELEDKLWSMIASMDVQ